MAKKDLFNKSERTIQTAEGDLGPKGHASFSSDLADRLLRLYPGEVIPAQAAKDAKLSDQEDESEGGDEGDEKPVEKWTKKECHDYLAANEVEFETDANVARLRELVQQHADQAAE